MARSLWLRVAVAAALLALAALALACGDAEARRAGAPSSSSSSSMHARRRTVQRRSTSDQAIELEEWQKSAARRWNEALLDAIRIDTPRPTVHARNLFHTSAAMWDAYAVYADADGSAALGRALVPRDVVAVSAADVGTDADAANRTLVAAVSHAAYYVLRHRFAESPGAAVSLPRFDALLVTLDAGTPLDDATASTCTESTPACVGARVGAHIVHMVGSADGANESNNYASTLDYSPLNKPLILSREDLPVEMNDCNRWQPLAFSYVETANSNVRPRDVQTFLSPHWGLVTPWALRASDASDSAAGVWLDPGAPPLMRTDASECDAELATFRANVVELLRFQSLLSPDNEARIDVSPLNHSNAPLGSYAQRGRSRSAPLYPDDRSVRYSANLVREYDYGRVLAEFWADGPSSETPPGHWNVIAADIASHPAHSRRWAGEGRELSAFEYDVRMYLAMNGALHDAAVAAWGAKQHYDYSRPISHVRYMAAQGQSSSPSLPRYSLFGLPLIDGLIEQITAESSADGERHAHLSEHIDEVAALAWDPSGVDGVHWRLAAAWTPYQQQTFVTPAFAGYVSGHSTFSRAAAEVLARARGTEFFPGGLFSLTFERNSFLHFEDGPSETMQLQWATVYDAADEAGISRIYGGIHPRADDLPGRIMGDRCARRSFDKVQTLFGARRKLQVLVTAAADDAPIDGVRVRCVFADAFHLAVREGKTNDRGLAKLESIAVADLAAVLADDTSDDEQHVRCEVTLAASARVVAVEHVVNADWLSAGRSRIEIVV